jgi:hypothetical protein
MIPRNVQIAGGLILIALLAAAIYGIQLKKRDERNKQQAAPAPLSAESANQAKFPAVLAFDDDGVLAQRELSAALPQEPSERVRMVLRTLLHQYMQSPSPHPVPTGSDVRAVYLTADGLCVVDVNAALADQHRSGMLIEQFTVMSMLETLSLNAPGVKRVKLLVEGKERVSLAGHADLASIYDMQAVHAAVKEYEHR